jgi:hypothetical protein
MAGVFITVSVLDGQAKTVWDAPAAALRWSVWLARKTEAS